MCKKLILNKARFLSIFSLVFWFTYVINHNEIYLWIFFAMLILGILLDLIYFYKYKEMFVGTYIRKGEDARKFALVYIVILVIGILLIILEYT